MNGSTNTSNLSTDSVSVNVHAAFRGLAHPTICKFHCCLYNRSDSLMMPSEGHLYEEKLFITPGLKLGVGVREVPVHRSSRRKARKVFLNTNQIPASQGASLEADLLMLHSDNPRTQRNVLSSPLSVLLTCLP